MSENDSFVVRPTKGNVVTSVICSVVFAGFLLWPLLLPGVELYGMMILMIPYYMIIGGFFVVSVVMLAYCRRWRLEVKDGHMTLHKLFGEPQTIRLSEVTVVKFDIIPAASDYPAEKVQIMTASGKFVTFRDSSKYVSYDGVDKLYALFNAAGKVELQK